MIRIITKRYKRLSCLFISLLVFCSFSFGGIKNQNEYCHYSNCCKCDKFHLTFGVGYYRLYLQNTKSTEFDDGDPDLTKLFEISYNKRTGYFVEAGVIKNRYTILASFYRWESVLNRNWGGTPEHVSCLSVNSITVKSAIDTKIYPNVLYVSFLFGCGAGWGQLTQPIIGDVVENYSFEPSLSIGSGIDIYFSRNLLIHSTAEYEMLHFNGNPSFILDNWSIKSGVRVKI